MKVVLTKSQLHIIGGALTEGELVLRNVHITPQFLEVINGNTWSRVYIDEGMARAEAVPGDNEPESILLCVDDLRDAQKLAKQTGKVQRVVVITATEHDKPVEISIVEISSGVVLSLETVEEFGKVKSRSIVDVPVGSYPDIVKSYPLDYDDRDFAIARLDAGLLINLLCSTQAKHIDFMIRANPVERNSVIRIRNRNVNTNDPRFEAILMPVRT